MILILAAGLFAAPNLTRETFPDYLPPEVSIPMEYRGATAADVEEAICQRLGEALQRVDYMREITCTARDNQARTVASMEPGGDMGRFLDDTRTEVEALTDLPEEAEDPIIRELYRTDLVAAIAVTGPMSFAHLENYTKQLEDRLFAVDGVADVVPVGVSQRQWQEERAEFSGQRAIILEIHKNREEDALRVMNALQAFITEETARRGGTVNLEITQDMTSIVKDRLQMLVGNGITDLLLVGLVMALFFRPRSAHRHSFGGCEQP